MSQQELPTANKLLVITYYWPPSGGSGVQRWLKFAKYLPQFGWQPYIFTPENPSFELKDETLARDVPPEVEVIHFPIWEPYRIFNRIARIFGKKSTAQIERVSAGKKTTFQAVTGWIRGNFFIPDARIFWVEPSVEFLKDFLKSNGIRTIVTTGPPHSLHLIGRKLKKKDPTLNWIADFRDPWSEWDLLDTFSLTDWARKRHRKMERKVLQKADHVITIAPFHVKRLEMLGGGKVELITNGFDEDDFRGIEKSRTQKFTIRHIGMVDELRDPRPFMQAAKVLVETMPDFSKHVLIEFIGSVNSTFMDFVKSDDTLSRITSFLRPVSHADLLKTYGDTDVQLLVLAHTVLAPGNLPGKFFEYLASGNFIFGIGPAQGDAADILRTTHAGIMIEREDADQIRSSLLNRFQFWLNGDREETRNVSAYTRKELTKKLMTLLK